MAKDDKPVIIIKKGGHGGHHGGAWKIAYADFVTAMMCFFLCMWLISTASITTRQSIASYFRKPAVFTEGSGMPLLLGGQGILDDAFTPPRPEDKRKLKNPSDDPSRRLFGETDVDQDKHYERDGRLPPKKNRGPDQITGLNSDKKNAEESRREIRLRMIAESIKIELNKIIKSNSQLANILGKIEASVEADGLKIEIMDTDRYSMFDSGSARIKRDAEAAFQQVTDVIKKYPNTVEIFGHTDATPFPSRAGGYTNWELSADRANAARRLIQSQGLPTQQITSVIGKASSELKVPDSPLAPANRRITLKLKFNWQGDIEPNDAKTSPEGLRKLFAPEVSEQEPEEPIAAANIVTPPALEVEPSKTPIPIPTTSDSRTGRIKLPDGPIIEENPEYMPQDKIFGNNPVLGARELSIH
jgi:chemotaxis protein MotB